MLRGPLGPFGLPPRMRFSQSPFSASNRTRAVQQGRQSAGFPSPANTPLRPSDDTPSPRPAHARASEPPHGAPHPSRPARGHHPPGSSIWNPALPRVLEPGGRRAGRGAREAEPSRGILLRARAGPRRAAAPSEGPRAGGGGEPQTQPAWRDLHAERSAATAFAPPPQAGKDSAALSPPGCQLPRSRRQLALQSPARHAAAVGPARVGAHRKPCCPC